MMLSGQFIKLFRELKLIFIEPFNEDQLGPNSYDVRLAPYYCDIKKWDYVNHCPVYGSIKEETSGWMFVPDGGTTLVYTVERIGSRGFIAPMMGARSTTRRSGITVCDCAGKGDVGYYDMHWTAELSAHIDSAHGIRGAELEIGSRFAQIFFEVCTPGKQYQGQYQANSFPLNMIPKKYRDQFEEETKNV